MTQHYGKLTIFLKGKKSKNIKTNIKVLPTVAARDVIFWGDLKLFNINTIQQRTRKTLLLKN